MHAMGMCPIVSGLLFAGLSVAGAATPSSAPASGTTRSTTAPVAADRTRYITAKIDGCVRIHAIGGDAPALGVVDDPNRNPNVHGVSDTKLVTLDPLAGQVLHEKIFTRTAIAGVAIAGDDRHALLWGYRQDNDDANILGERSFLCVWDVIARREVATLGEEARSRISFAALSRDTTRVAVILDSNLQVWDVAARKVCGSIRVSAKVTAMAISADGKQALIGADERVDLLDLATGASLRRFERHTARITSVSFSPDGKRVLTTSADGSSRVWDALGGGQVAAMQLKNQQVYRGTFAPDGKRIVTISFVTAAPVAGPPSSPRARVLCWDIATGTIPGGSDTVISLNPTVAFGNRGREIHAAGRAGREGAYCVFPMPGEKWYPPSTNPVVTRVSRLDSPRLAVVSTRPTTAPAPLCTFDGGDVSSLLFRDPTTLAVADLKTRVLAIDTDTGKATSALRTEPGIGLRSAAFSQDGAYLAYAGERDFAIAEVSTGFLIHRVRAESDIEAVAANADGTYAAFARRIAGGPLGGFDVSIIGRREKQEVAGLAFERMGNPRLCFSADGNRLLVLGNQLPFNNARAFLWDLKSGETRDLLKDEQFSASDGSFSRDNEELAIAMYNGVRILRLRGDRPARHILMPGGIRRVIFSPDGKHLITGGFDSNVRVWSLATGAEIGVFTGLKYEVRSLAVSPDGKRLASASGEEPVRVDAFPKE